MDPTPNSGVSGMTNAGGSGQNRGGGHHRGGRGGNNNRNQGNRQGGNHGNRGNWYNNNSGNRQNHNGNWNNNGGGWNNNGNWNNWHNNNGFSGRGNGRGLGRGGSYPANRGGHSGNNGHGAIFNPNIECQLCFRMGHGALYCQNNAAYMAYSDPYILDSGATNHMTADPSSFSGSYPYSGFEAPKLRKLADKVAAAGFYVVVPDYFQGDTYTPGEPRPIQEWLKIHGPVPAAESTKPVIQALKSKGLLKVGAAGFCWGAKVVVELAKSADIEAAVLLHPSFVAVDDIKGVEVPIAILGAEFDHLSPPEVVKQFEVALEAKPEIDHFVKIFPGVSHGWTVRYNDDDELAIKSANEAHQDMLNWFTKYIKV